MNAEIQEMIDTLRNIEILAISGTIPGELTDITALMLRHELADSDTQSDALERAQAFVVQCQQNTLAKVS